MTGGAGGGGGGGGVITAQYDGVGGADSHSP